MPSGDSLTTLRLVVPRVGQRKGDAGPTVDTIDCAFWLPALRRRAEGLSSGSVIQVQGALRRRFWRAGSSAVSRYEVEVRAFRRVRDA